MPIQSYRLGPMDNSMYVVIDPATREAAIVDPTFDSETVWPELQSRGLTVRFILNTHAHFDHVIGDAFYVAQTHAPLALHPADWHLLRALPEQGRMFGITLAPAPEPDIALEHGASIMLGETSLKVLHTPGHSPGSVTFLVEDAAITGDCLFAGSIGRTDIPGASYESLMRSVREELLSLPDATRVLPGHGRQTTIGEERATNPYLAPAPGSCADG